MKNITIGIDLGDKKHFTGALNADGKMIETGTVANTKEAIIAYSRKYPGATMVLEAGTHSPWISRLLTDLGHRVLIGNPRKLRMIWNSDNKSDRRDAEMLARIGRFDPDLLSPLQHRGKKAQVDMTLIKARDTLVKSRTSMINLVRNTVKGFGHKVTSCVPQVFIKWPWNRYRKN